MGESRTLLPAQLRDGSGSVTRHYVSPVHQARVAARRDEQLELFQRAIRRKPGRQVLACAIVDEFVQLLLSSTRSGARPEGSSRMSRRASANRLKSWAKRSSPVRLSS